MVLFHPNREVYDPIRKRWLDAFPEEIVRQKVLFHLVKDLGYPAPSIIIEKSLSELPFLESQNVPNRRIDLLCSESQTLRPLLLVECKAVPLQEKMFAQALGYNVFIGAPLICLANQEGFLLRWENDSVLSRRNQLPTYEQLRDS